MRTTLDLPGNLLNEAMEVTHTGTKTAVIVKELEELARKSKITGLKKYKVKLFWILILMKSEIVHNGGFGRHLDVDRLFSRRYRFQRYRFSDR